MQALPSSSRSNCASTSESAAGRPTVYLALTHPSPHNLSSRDNGISSQRSPPQILRTPWPLSSHPNSSQKSLARPLPSPAVPCSLSATPTSSSAALCSRISTIPSPSPGLTRGSTTSTNTTVR
ncbi:hypothetical protein BDZ91DRAFT_460032 [Kalaharituber pfeilii]|nr:hypothetical protein BDZ91DRAFT_460032 [Kalaharituber pfeilii]